MNILVVADGNFNLKMAQDIIETNIDDSQVFLCSSSEKVIQKIDEYDIDIVLLDIIMPNITGMDLLKNIRSQKKYNDVQIIIFTGITDKESFTLCFEHGANDYINKPIDFTEFIARMKASVKARKNILFLKEQNNIIKEQYNKLQVITQELEENQFNIIQKEKFISLGEIIAGIAHEINNPMGYISSNLATMNNYIEKIKNIVNVYRKFIQLIDEKTITLAKLIQEKNMIDDIERKQKTEFIMDELTTIVLESSEGADRVKK
jgi:Response regulator containing a CheY-like receiver domain and an HD-GYP domain